MNSTTTNDNLKKMVTAALLAALTCAATMSVRIPTLGTGGYIHPGDALVILCGIILGPSWGFLAGGIGSALADLLGGYFIYVPITLAIKGLVALSSGSHYPSVILGGIADIILVAGGYFLCESIMYGVAGASASVPANLIQGAGGLVIACILYPLIRSIPGILQLNHKAEAHS